MRADDRVRRLAIEFGCQWLHVRDFDKFNEKSDEAFPEFADLRDDMYEESVLFFTDLFQNDGSLLDVLDADHTFLNETLAAHYDIRHHVRRVTRSEFLADMPRILDAMDQPTIDGINTWYASKAVAERGLKVGLYRAWGATSCSRVTRASATCRSSCLPGGRCVGFRARPRCCSGRLTGNPGGAGTTAGIICRHGPGREGAPSGDAAKGPRSAIRQVRGLRGVVRAVRICLPRSSRRARREAESWKWIPDGATRVELQFESSVISVNSVVNA